MGNVASKNASSQWPPNYTKIKSHWCLAFQVSYIEQIINIAQGTEDKNAITTCTDLEPNPDFDYSQFHCSKAKCQVCLDINFDYFPARELCPGSMSNEKDPMSREVHFIWHALLGSASREMEPCQSCLVLMSGIALVDGVDRDRYEEEVYCLELREGGSVRLLQERRKDDEGRVAVEFYSKADETTPWAAFGVAGSLKEELEVEDCVTFIENCMRKCLDHPNCAATQAAIIPQLPKRLIDVGTRDDDIKLEESPQTGELYTTLSHCWGTEPIPRSLKANVKQLCENISWSSLTKTFQEAITITRAMRIRYIWIDSLCIIQDSKEDWESEARHMADIYTKSHLTLAATSSSQSSGGLLKPRYAMDRDKSIHPHREFKINWDSFPGTVYARRCITSSHDNLLSQKTELSDRMASVPLLNRAWVLQERLLSPRILHFCSDELVWECKNGADCECGYAASKSGKFETESPSGEGRFVKLFNKREFRSDPATAGEDKSAVSAEYEEELLWAWYRLVEYYTTLDITFSSDRLPAIKGLASSIEENMKWKSIHGLWHHDIIRGLLWKRNFSPTQRSTDIATPSWSWAALECAGSERPLGGGSFVTPINGRPTRLINGVVQHHSDDSNYEIDERFQLVDTSMKAGQGDVDFVHSYKDFVSGTEPFLVLRTAMIDANVGFENDPDVANSSVTTSGHSVTIGDAKSETSSQPSEAKIALRLFTFEKNAKIDVTWDVESNEGNSEVKVGDELSCLLLSLCRTGDAPYDGIVVRKNKVGAYSRVGYFSCNMNGEGAVGFFAGDLFQGAMVQQIVLV